MEQNQWKRTIAEIKISETKYKSQSKRSLKKPVRSAKIDS